MLYPFKFQAQLFHKIWGGHTIEQWYDHVPADYENVGEAWVMSDVEKYPTEVVNGSHAGDSLQDLLEVYMDELVGERVYELFGNHFPLLLKFIDATDDLSIQVHPDDEYALENEQCLGKTEMWYVLPSSEEASIYLGWNKEMNASLIHSAIQDGSLARYLREYKVRAGDVAYIPSGTVHAMRRNTIVAEIQENSDVTYRLYDWGRPREIHVEKGLQSIKPAAAEAIKPLGAQFDCNYFTLKHVEVKGGLSWLVPAAPASAGNGWQLVYIAATSGMGASIYATSADGAKSDMLTLHAEEIYALAPGEKITVEGNAEIVRIIANKN